MEIVKEDLTEIFFNKIVDHQINTYVCIAHSSIIKINNLVHFNTKPFLIMVILYVTLGALLLVRVVPYVAAIFAYGTRR